MKKKFEITATVTMSVTAADSGEADAGGCKHCKTNG